MGNLDVTLTDRITSVLTFGKISVEIYLVKMVVSVS